MNQNARRDEVGHKWFRTRHKLLQTWKMNKKLFLPWEWSVYVSKFKIEMDNLLVKNLNAFVCEYMRCKIIDFLPNLDSHFCFDLDNNTFLNTHRLKFYTSHHLTLLNFVNLLDSQVGNKSVSDTKHQRSKPTTWWQSRGIWFSNGNWNFLIFQIWNGVYKLITLILACQLQIILVLRIASK